MVDSPLIARIPLQGVANATISIETAQLAIDLEALLDNRAWVEGARLRSIRPKHYAIRKDW